MLVFLGNNQLVSAKVRGVQIAEYLDAPYHDAASYNQSYTMHTCIWVKQRPAAFWPERSWVDIMDEAHLRGNLRGFGRPVGVISFTKASHCYLTRYLRNYPVQLVYIPQHHCNFEQSVRPQREVRVVGFIGNRIGLGGWEEKTLRDALHEVGLELRCLFFGRSAHECNLSRSDVIDFYNNIDIQVSFRLLRGMFHRFKDSLRVINAGSFGIPSVSCPELHLVENFQNSAILVDSMEELVRQCAKLRDEPQYYQEISGRIFEISADYHISKIAPLYLELDSLPVSK